MAKPQTTSGSRAGMSRRQDATRPENDVEANRRWFEAKLRAQRQIYEVVRKVKGDPLPDSDFLLIDSRSREEYAKGHIPGALSLPLKELDRLVGRLPRDKELVVYCGSMT